jgi:hypothetical protein
MQNCEMERMIDQAVEITWKVWMKMGLSVASWNAFSGQQMWDRLWTALLLSEVPEALAPMQWFWREPVAAQAAFVARWDAGQYRKEDDAGRAGKLPV